MNRKTAEHYIIKPGANSDPENLAKLSCIYNKLKARMILKELEGYPDDVAEEVIKRLCKDKEIKEQQAKH